MPVEVYIPDLNIWMQMRERDYKLRPPPKAIGIYTNNC